MKALRAVVAALAVLALEGQAAFADQILFSNLGPNSSYEPHVATFFGFDEDDEEASRNFSRAMAFVPNATATLTTLELPLEFPWFTHPWFDGGTLEVNLFDSVGGLPGRLLESFSSTGTHLPDALSVFRSIVQPELIAGLTYFVEARAVGEANGLWQLTTVGREERFTDIRRFGNEPWEVGQRFGQAAFRVSGEVQAAPTPEPTTLVLLGSGMAMAAWRRRRVARHDQ